MGYRFILGLLLNFLKSFPFEFYLFYFSDSFKFPHLKYFSVFVYEKLLCYDVELILWFIFHLVSSILIFTILNY